jgi:hypothetical protein
VGDGLFLSRTPPEQIPPAWAETQAAAREAGRDPGSLTLTSFARLRWTTDAETVAAVRTLRALAGAGVQHIVLQFNQETNPHPLSGERPDIDAATAYIQRFVGVVRRAAGL